MRHITCDLCGQDVSDGLAKRYVVRVEGFAACDPCECDDRDADSDSVEMMAELLTQIESGECDGPDDAPPANARKEYDLCGCCYAKFLADPLGLEHRRKPHFSKN